MNDQDSREIQIPVVKDDARLAPFRLPLWPSDAPTPPDEMPAVKVRLDDLPIAPLSVWPENLSNDENEDTNP